MKRLLLVALLVVACDPAPAQSVPGSVDPGTVYLNAQTIQKWHDDVAGVTCWVSSGTYKGGISCLPDSELKPR